MLGTHEDLSVRLRDPEIIATFKAAARAVQMADLLLEFAGKAGWGWGEQPLDEWVPRLNSYLAFLAEATCDPPEGRSLRLLTRASGGPHFLFGELGPASAHDAALEYARRIRFTCRKETLGRCWGRPDEERGLTPEEWRRALRSFDKLLGCPPRPCGQGILAQCLHEALRAERLKRRKRRPALPAAGERLLPPPGKRMYVEARRIILEAVGSRTLERKEIVIKSGYKTNYLKGVLRAMVENGELARDPEGKGYYNPSLRSNQN